MISHHHWKTSDLWRSCTVLVWGDIFQQQLCFCITVYNCMNRTFDGNHCGYLHSEPALLDFNQNASHAFKTSACTPESIFSLHWTWGETCDPEVGGGQQRRAGCPQPQPDRSCFSWLLSPSSFLHTRSLAPAANKSRNLDHLRAPPVILTREIKQNQFHPHPLNPGRTAFPKCGPGEALHRLGCGWEADTLW